MPVNIKISENTLTAEITGELDQHSAREIRAKTDTALLLSKPENTVLDFGGVTFMDSSGIGLIMGRYRLCRQFGGKVCVQNTSPHIKRVLQISGIEQIVDVK